MQYPLHEKIGIPELLVGRVEEFQNFDRWLKNIPRRLSKSRVLLARRKSGKTVFVQRIFNQVWSENGHTVPFYLDIGENKYWYPDFAIKYFEEFATQYISFLERDEHLVGQRWRLDQIQDYGRAKSLDLLVQDVTSILQYQAQNSHSLLWDVAHTAPHRYADYYGRSALVLLDEFQNIAQYIYRDEKCAGQPDDTMPGSFHSLSESKLAPMLVTGSYVGWLLSIIDKYLEAGRLTRMYFSPYLTPEAGLEAVYRYAEVYDVPIINETALQISTLCMADPFFISCVIQSNYAQRDLTTSAGVIEAVNFEISDRESEMSRTWAEYIELTLQRINDRHAKNLLLFLSKHNDRVWTPQELKDALQLDLDPYEIQRKLLTLVESDLLRRGSADIEFHGLQDGTLNLVLRSRFQREIENFAPNFRQEFQAQIDALRTKNRSLQGMLNHLAGKVAEYQLANEWRARKRFRLAEYFAGVTTDRTVNVTDVRERVTFQRADGKGQELDVLAQSSDGVVSLVEVRKRAEKSTLADVEDLRDKAAAYAHQHPGQVVLPAFLSLGGFTPEAQEFCQQSSIMTAEQITYIWNE